MIVVCVVLLPLLGLLLSWGAEIHRGLRLEDLRAPVADSGSPKAAPGAASGPVTPGRLSTRALSGSRKARPGGSSPSSSLPDVAERIHHP